MDMANQGTCSDLPGTWLSLTLGVDAQVAEHAVHHLLTTVPVHADEHKPLKSLCCAVFADNSAAVVYAFPDNVSVPYSGEQHVPKQSLLLLQMALSAEPSSW